MVIFSVQIYTEEEDHNALNLLCLFTFWSINQIFYNIQINIVGTQNMAV